MTSLDDLDVGNGKWDPTTVGEKTRGEASFEIKTTTKFGDENQGVIITITPHDGEPLELAVWDLTNKRALKASGAKDGCRLEVRYDGPGSGQYAPKRLFSFRVISDGEVELDELGLPAEY